MKNNQSMDDSPLHQTMAEGLEFKTDRKVIAAAFTAQKSSAHAGSAPFAPHGVYGVGRPTSVFDLRSERATSKKPQKIAFACESRAIFFTADLG
jgi:hypothetical protein